MCLTKTWNIIRFQTSADPKNTDSFHFIKRHIPLLDLYPDPENSHQYGSLVVPGVKISDSCYQWWARAIKGSVQRDGWCRKK